MMRITTERLHTGIHTLHSPSAVLPVVRGWQAEQEFITTYGSLCYLPRQLRSWLPLMMFALVPMFTMTPHGSCSLALCKLGLVHPGSVLQY